MKFCFKKVGFKFRYIIFIKIYNTLDTNLKSSIMIMIGIDNFIYAGAKYWILGRPDPDTSPQSL